MVNKDCLAEHAAAKGDVGYDDYNEESDASEPFDEFHEINEGHDNETKTTSDNIKDDEIITNNLIEKSYDESNNNNNNNNLIGKIYDESYDDHMKTSCNEDNCIKKYDQVVEYDNNNNSNNNINNNKNINKNINKFYDVVEDNNVVPSSEKTEENLVAVTREFGREDAWSSEAGGGKKNNNNNNKAKNFRKMMHQIYKEMQHLERCFVVCCFNQILIYG